MPAVAVIGLAGSESGGASRPSTVPVLSKDERMVRVRDLIAVGGIIVAFATIADWRYRHPGDSIWFEADYNVHLGAEYDEIARAIRAGRGFSDPFRVRSGPTAWMPPALPYILAGLYWVADDDREVVVEMVVGLKCLILALTCLIVVRESRRLGRAWLGYAVVVAGLATHFHAMFQRTHDEWLLLLVLDVIWLLTVRLWTPPTTNSAAAGWGIFGGVAALCSPVAGTTWAVITLVRWFPRKHDSVWVRRETIWQCKPLAIATLCAIVTIAPWMFRNRVTLGKWILIKSNGVYEIWQAQCVDDDGILDTATFAGHPWAGAGEQRAEYVAKGELEFIGARWPEVQESVGRAPHELFRRIGNRLLAACLWYTPSVHERQQPAWLLDVKRVAFALPSVCVVLVVLMRARPIERQVLASIWIYGVFLAPYVLIAYYERYSAPLMGVKMLLLTCGFDTLLGTLGRRR